jgi:hypothetical protein
VPSSTSPLTRKAFITHSFPYLSFHTYDDNDDDYDDDDDNDEDDDNNNNNNIGIQCNSASLSI